ncbi:MAG: hypothetical protein JXL80_06840 [Planctomycetes bacterium]|nr:hypothetical protein [Planctomycetota bacterium]
MVLWLAVLAAGSLGGCTWFSGGAAGDEGIHVKVQPLPSQSQDRDLYQLQVYFLTERVDPERPTPDFWRFFDETLLDVGRRRLLEANGLRIAAGGRLAVERLNEVIDSSDNLSSRLASSVKVTPGQILDVPLGRAMEDTTVFCTDADGTVWGREFPAATTMVRVHCQASERPNHTEVSIAEEIVYGDPQPKHIPAGESYVMGMAPPRFRLSDLDSKIVIREGQIVAIGLSPGKPQSIGETLFAVESQGRRRVTTLLVQPVLMRPGQPLQDTPAPIVR